MMNNWLEGLRSMLCKKPEAFLGVYGAADRITFLELSCDGGTWAVGRKAEEKWQRPQDFGEMTELLAEHITMRLAREGWENLPLALCLPEGEFICKLFPMSGEIPREEQRTAAFWEIDNYLQACGLTLENVSCTSARLPGEETVEALILLREKIRTLEEAFDSKEIRLEGLFPETPLVAECRLQEEGWQIGGLQLWGSESAGDKESLEGERRSLYAAAALAGLGNDSWPENLLAWKKEESPWNYEGIGRLVMMVAAVFAAVMLVVDLGELYLASRAAEEARQQMAALEPARLVMEADRKMASLAESKEACLAGLSEKSRPLDSVLIHLGTVTVEGAWLTEVDCTQESLLLLRGEAVDYSALGEIMEAFEKDRGFFPSVPLLEDSRQREDEGGGIEFRLKMDMGI